MVCRLDLHRGQIMFDGLVVEDGVVAWSGVRAWTSFRHPQDQPRDERKSGCEYEPVHRFLVGLPPLTNGT